MAEIARRPLRTRWVTWLTNGQEAVGSGQVTWSEFSIRFRYVIEGMRGQSPGGGERDFSIRPVARGSHSFRFHVICRHCGEYVYRLLYRTEHWLCQSCQHLRHRSSFLSPQLCWQEEYDYLRYFIGDGRPPGMREVEYARQRRRMTELKDKLDGSGRRPGPEFDFAIYAQWHDRDPEG